MNENLTELVFILDRSGSMSGLESDTIGGFNSMIAKQKQEAGEALVSTVLFDDCTRVIHDQVDLREDRAVRYACDSAGTSLNYEVVGRAVGCIRGGRGLDRTWKAEIEKNFEERGSSNVWSDLGRHCGQPL